MVVVIDVGNTNIVIGVYKAKELVKYWRISTDRSKSSDEYKLLMAGLFNEGQVDLAEIEGVVVSSVVPPIMHSLENAIWKLFQMRPLIVKAGVKTGINIKYDNPESLGTDRLVNAVAAYHLYGGPVIIIDCGTATKLCAVSKSGDFLGGMICPGIKISVDALIQNAAKLQGVELVKPPSVIGKNTVHSMQSGIIFGYAGMIDYLVSMMKKELGESDVKVVATGGLVRLVSGETEAIQEVNDHLTLEGLRIIGEKNRAELKNLAKGIK